MIIKELRGKFIKHWGYDEVGEYHYRIVTPRNTPVSTIYEYLRSRYSSWCTHSYDCCGCQTYSYSVTKAGNREWKISVFIGRNF